MFYQISPLLVCLQNVGYLVPIIGDIQDSTSSPMRLITTLSLAILLIAIVDLLPVANLRRLVSVAISISFHVLSTRYGLVSMRTPSQLVFSQIQRRLIDLTVLVDVVHDLLVLLDGTQTRGEHDEADGERTN